MWERETGEGKGVGRTEVLGSEGGKRNRGQWKQKSVRPWGQAAWCPQSSGPPLLQGEWPLLYNHQGMFCPRVKDRIYHAGADT